MIKLLVNLRVKTLGGQGGVPLGAREEDSNNDNGDMSMAINDNGNMIMI